MLERVEKKTGRRPAGLNVVPVPEGMHYLIDMFWDLKRSQQPVTYQEIEAWARLCQGRLEPQEVRLLMALDGVVAKVQREINE